MAEAVALVVVFAFMQAHLAQRPTLTIDASADRRTSDAAADIVNTIALPHVQGEV